MNWQLVTLDVPAEELRDAPVLYLGGDQELRFSEADEAKLKTFVNTGGMILANADFNSKPFVDSFLKLGTKLYGYEFRELESNSPNLPRGNAHHEGSLQSAGTVQRHSRVDDPAPKR